MVTVLSAKRCGSTIIQNITYIILYGKKGRIKKHHENLKNLHGKIIIPIRHPLDVAISIRRTLVRDYYSKNKIEEGIIESSKFLDNKIVTTQLNLMNSLYKTHINNKNALILRYEDIFANGVGDYEIVTEKICNFLNIKKTDELMSLINEILDYENLSRISNKIKSFKQTDMGNTSYGLHGGHISTKNILNWKNKIPENLHDECLNKVDKHLKILNYK